MSAMVGLAWLNMWMILEPAAFGSLSRLPQTLVVPGFGQPARPNMHAEGATSAAESSYQGRQREATPQQVQLPDREGHQQDSPLIQRGLVLNLDTGMICCHHPSGGDSVNSL